MTTGGGGTLNARKFKALVHHIIHKCGDHPEQLGATRLNKVLWFSDIIVYQIKGVSITGETYVKRMFGPVPYHILETLRGLKKDGCIVIKEPEHPYDTREFKSERSPDPDILSEEEKRVASVVLDAILGRSANNVSEKSHDIIWDAAKEGEEIPLYATLVAVPGEITEEMIEWAKQVVSDHKAA